MSFVDFTPLFNEDILTVEAKNDLVDLASDSVQTGCTMAVHKMKDSGMSLQKIADEFGYSLSMISYIGTGKKVFGVRSYERMSVKFLHRSVHEILTGDTRGVQLTVIPTLMMNIMEVMPEKNRKLLVKDLRDRYSGSFIDESVDPDVTLLMQERFAELSDHRCCAEDRLLYASGNKLVKSEPYKYSAYQNSLLWAMDRIMLRKIEQPGTPTVLSFAIMLEVPADYFLVRDYTKTADWIEYAQEKKNGRRSMVIIRDKSMLETLSMWLLLPAGKREELAADVMAAGARDKEHPITPKTRPDRVRMPEI